MKRVLVALAALVLVFLIVYLNSIKNVEERYYTGIGIILTDSEMGVRVSDVLKGSPAEKAGLKTGDVIVRVNGSFAKSFSENSVINFVRSGKVGHPVIFRIFREDEKERDVGRLLYIQVERAKIDSVAWIPTGSVLSSWVSFGEYRFEAQAKVSENKKTGEFVYWHKILNLSKNDMYVFWRVVGSRSNLKWFDVILPTFPIKLRAGESKEFVLKSKLAPSMKNEPAFFSSGIFWGAKYSVGATSFIPMYKQ